MHSCVASKNVKWCHLIWPTLYFYNSAPSTSRQRRGRGSAATRYCSTEVDETSSSQKGCKTTAVTSRNLFGQYDNLLYEPNREDPASYTGTFSELTRTCLERFLTERVQTVQKMDESLTEKPIRGHS